MRRVAGVILVVALLASGSGLMGELHRLEHGCGPVGRGAGWGWEMGEAGHDEANCAVCLTLHMPLLSAGYVPLLICVGIWVEFLTLLRPRLNPQRVQRSVDCRGPPVH